MADDFDFGPILSQVENLTKSGKWEEANNLAIGLHEAVNQEDEWLATVFTSLHYRNCLEYKKLKSVIKMEEDILSDIAWHTRNLLELCVWVMYCCQNRENARVFYGDAARDGHEIVSVFQKWSITTGLYPQDEKSYTDAVARLEQSAANKNVYAIFTKLQFIGWCYEGALFNPETLTFFNNVNVNY